MSDSHAVSTVLRSFLQVQLFSHMQVKAPSISQRYNHNPSLLSSYTFRPPPSPAPSNQTRRGELSGLQPYLPSGSIAPQGTPVLLAGVPVHEQGPLARCSPFMDAAARRVLPGHLLRRARVLSSLQVCQQREYMYCPCCMGVVAWGRGR